MIDAKSAAAIVSRLEEECPLLEDDGSVRCPRCGRQSEFMDPLSIVPKYDRWLTAVRKCPECYHVFALLTDAALDLLPLYAHLA